jgi:hypothetical protein
MQDREAYFLQGMSTSKVGIFKLPDCFITLEFKIVGIQMITSWDDIAGIPMSFSGPGKVDIWGGKSFINKSLEN